jgi:hypothetical protein
VRLGEVELLSSGEVVVLVAADDSSDVRCAMCDMRCSESSEGPSDCSAAARSPYM